MTSVARAALRAYIEWGTSSGGVLGIAVNDADLSVGTIAVNDADVAAGVIASTDWVTATFQGPYDDVSSRLARVSTTRGRNDPLSEMVAGSATLDLRDHDGTLNPANPTSPIYATIDDRLHPARIVWRWLAGEVPLFTGWARHVSWEPNGRRGVAQVDLVDLFYWLDRDFPVIAPTGPTTTGAAIGLILDYIGWIEPTLRDLDTGDDIPGFEADGSTSALQLIAGLLEAELGVFYISAGGVARYESRHARGSRPVSASIVDRMTRVVGSLDFDVVHNRVQVMRTQNDYVAEAIDVASRALGRVGPSDLPMIETPYLSTDAQAEALADWLLTLELDPKPPIRSLQIDNRELDLLTQIIERELVDRVTIEEGAGGTAGDYHLERISIDVTAAQHGRISADWLLSRASGSRPLFIAANDADTAAGTIAVDDADVAAGVVVY